MTTFYYRRWQLMMIMMMMMMTMSNNLKISINQSIKSSICKAPLKQSSQRRLLHLSKKCTFTHAAAKTPENQLTTVYAMAGLGEGHARIGPLGSATHGRRLAFTVGYSKIKLRVQFWLYFNVFRKSDLWQDINDAILLFFPAKNAIFG